MRDFVLVLASIALTAVMWGVYGPIIRNGQTGMEGSHLLPFVWVGLAYFVIAVVVPGVLIPVDGRMTRPMCTRHPLSPTRRKIAESTITRCAACSTRSRRTPRT